MTPEQINRAIAEACGWRNIGKTFKNGFLYYDAWESPDGTIYAYAPNYHGDLNAMREAESMLESVIQIKSYCYHLTRQADPEYATLHLVTEYATLHLVMASAADKAEAFLRTLGKWEEGE